MKSNLENKVDYSRLPETEEAWNELLQEEFHGYEGDMFTLSRLILQLGFQLGEENIKAQYREIYESDPDVFEEIFDSEEEIPDKMNI